MAQGTLQPKEYDVLPGVTLTVLPTDRFKVGMLSLCFALPFSREQATARSLLMSVLRRGCVSYPTIADINRRLDELYATPYRAIDTTRAGVHYVGFGAELLDDRYVLDDMDLCGEVVSLISEMLFHPLMEKGILCERYVAQEKKNTLDHLRALQNQPGTYAMARFLDAFHENDPLSLPILNGAEARIGAQTPELLTEQWRDILRHGPMQCFYIGGMEPDRLVDCLRDMLSPYLDGLARELVPIKAACRTSPGWDGVRYVEEEGDQGQSHLILGFRTPVTLQSPDYFATMLCHELLGQSPISRLFVHVREAHSLCYSISSRYRMLQGEMTVACGISAENRERAEGAILEQIEVLKRGEWSEAEWLAAQKSLVGSCRQLEDSTRSLSDFYKVRLPLCPEHTPAEYVARFEAVTREEVMAAAEKLHLEMVYFRQGTGEDEEDGDD
jgi:predicted Zn-dependent peptidase